MPLDRLERVRRSEASLATTGAAYGFSVLSQVIAISTIPVASASLAPQPQFIGMPYGAMLIGALLATFPASYLMDIFGRRAAFALGASLGHAGGCIAAWGIAWGQFTGLVLGSFWLGVAQGFGLFYRHAAALGSGARAVGFVLGSGCVAALVAPGLLALIAGAAGPFAGAVAAFVAGASSLATLACAMGLPAAAPVIYPARSDLVRGDFVLATGLGALAWFLMTALMGSAPLLMVDCGIGGANVATPIAGHILAMYFPALVAGLAIDMLGGALLCLLGVALISVAAGLTVYQHSLAGFSVVLIGAGCGWSLATLGATVWLHRSAAPSRTSLAVQDFCLFAAAIGGAFLTFSAA
jgi:hypothetical protein